ncbi:MAG: sensor histidine kinase [Oscillospiraceae bacterium]|jgi:signal transduction histidine kinase|nr:sensor histidine kinase [Oscillospiraceae bacterium]
MKKSIIITVSLLLICGVAYYFSSFPFDTLGIAAADGTADLQAAVSGGQIVAVTSGWRSYPGKLYAPEDFAAGTVSAPVQWENKYGEGESVGSHRMILLLPAGETTAIRFRSVDYATKVYINGAFAGEVGTVGATKEETTPRVSDCYFVVTPETAETEIIIQYANFHHRRGGYPPELTVGAPAALTRLSQKDTGAQVMVAGLLFTAFLYHLAMFLLYGERRTFLYFAMCCLTFAIRAMLPLFIVFIPDYNWPLMIRIEYIDMFSGAALFILFSRNMFPELFSKRILWTGAAVLAAYNIIVIFTAPALFSRLLVIIQPLCLIIVGYITVRLGLALRKGGLTVFLAFAGIALFLVAAVNDVLYLNKLPNVGENLMPVSISVMTLAYMMILSIEFAENERRLEAEAGRLSMEMAMKEQALAADNAALDRLSRMKTELITTVSHETKTPLAVLSVYAELIAKELRRKGVDEQAAKDLDTIMEETQRISRLMDELQDHIRKQDGRLLKTRLDLNELINGVVRLYTPIMARKNNKLTIHIFGDLPDSYACSGEITQVLFNLLQNAHNHSESGKIDIAAAPEKDGIVVTVSDTGGGIPPELLPHLFERGESGDENGTGLGLYICKEIIDRHGGVIDIESEPGRGTAVRFTLPAWKEETDIGQENSPAG